MAVYMVYSDQEGDIPKYSVSPVQFRVDAAVDTLILEPSLEP